ncbi:MAG: hypothetical protein WA771_06480 [Chthoniobacterales bacterium]
MKIVVGVGIAAQPISAVGIAWTSLNWPLGFRELGWEVWVVEGLDSARCVDANWNSVPFEGSANQAHWDTMMAAFDLTDRSTLLVDDQATNLEELRAFAAEADVFLNLSGHFKSPTIEFPKAVKVYLDGDPAFSQTWVESYDCDMNFAAHDRFVTVGTNWASPDRFAPDCGIDWIPSFPPVTLRYWPFQPQESFDRFTTIAHWEGYKNSEWRGQWFTGKREEFQRFIDVPRDVPRPVELAMHVHDHRSELDPFRDAGWEFREARGVCGSLEDYQNYVATSSAEFSVAKGGYVLSCAGWFSDRSVCYAAMGRPLVLQDTGASNVLPAGEGYHPFTTPAEAVAACERVIADFPAQQMAARRLAEEHFASEVVLPKLLDRI